MPSPLKPNTKLLTIADVARLLSVSESHVRHLVRNGYLESIKMGKHRRFTSQQVAKYIASLVGTPWEVGSGDLRARLRKEDQP